MDREALIKALLSLGVALLTKLIPALSGGVLGIVLGWAVSWLTGLLIDWTERLARFKGIEADVAKDLANAQNKRKALLATITKEDYAKARQEFDAAVRDLGRWRLR